MKIIIDTREQTALAKYGAIKEPRIGDSLKERPKPSQANSINLPAEAWRIADLIVENVKALNPKAYFIASMPLR